MALSGLNSAEATNDVWLDRIKGPCKTFELAYDFGKTGSFAHLDVFPTRPGEIFIGGQGDRYTGERGRLAYPERNEVQVLHNSGYVLAKASCRD